MKTKGWKFILLFSDLVSAVFSWIGFFYLRQEWIEKKQFNSDSNFFLGLLIIPLFWVFFYFIQGTYYDVRRQFRIKIFNLTTIASILGTIILFFSLILDDNVRSYRDYYQLFFLLFGIHFLTTLLPRLFIVTFLIKNIRKKGGGFKTLFIGGNEKALELYQEISSHPKNVNEFVGFVNVNGKDKLLGAYIPYLGHEKDLETIILKNSIEEIIIAIEVTDHDCLKNILL